MAYKRTAMLELARERPFYFLSTNSPLQPPDPSLCGVGRGRRGVCGALQFLLEELRAQVEEQTNRNLYIQTMFSVIFLPATLIGSLWDMNVGGIPFSTSPNGFWVIAGLMAAAFALAAVILFRLRFKSSKVAPNYWPS
jgi:hypothetical protein